MKRAFLQCDNGLWRIVLLLSLAVVVLGSIRVDAAGKKHGKRQNPIDEYGVMDTVSVEITDLGDNQWLATVLLDNDENLAAVTLPFRWHGDFRLDSAGYAQTRVAYFALKTFYPDTVAQTILIGLISDLGTRLPPLEPGHGPIAQLYFTATGTQKRPLSLDTTFLRPHNVLQMVTPDKRAILPVFIGVPDRPQAHKSHSGSHKQE